LPPLFDCVAPPWLLQNLARPTCFESFPPHLIWDSLHIRDEEKVRTERPWKDKVFYVEWRTKDQSNVKVYEQKRTVDYADYKVGLFEISPFDLFFEGEAVITKLGERKSRSLSK
jgi:hypothetical protein